MSCALKRSVRSKRNHLRTTSSQTEDETSSCTNELSRLKQLQMHQITCIRNYVAIDYTDCPIAKQTLVDVFTQSTQSVAVFAQKLQIFPINTRLKRIHKLCTLAFKFLILNKSPIHRQVDGFYLSTLHQRTHT